jgi:hypothetical protein
MFFVYQYKFAMLFSIVSQCVFYLFWILFGLDDTEQSSLYALLIILNFYFIYKITNSKYSFEKENVHARSMAIFFFIFWIRGFNYFMNFYN